ncbi:transcriptional adapter 2-beta isoform X1 [Hydra vulgaris]|nr:transcriptional adapter 2-beta [Hydra vulgaris]
MSTGNNQIQTLPIQDATKYHCNSCFGDCSGLRVSCADCAEFDACLHCFASGVEVGNHKKNHRYSFIDNGTFSLFVPNWTADEEMLLLDGIEQHGLGNWDDVADHVGTKSFQEVQEHFEDIYLWKNIGTATLTRGLSEIRDHTAANAEFFPSIHQTEEIIDLPPSEQLELGYKPLRDDFEREYDNDTENLVKNLVCSRDDDELETALKLSMVDMYWRSLKERARFKKIAKQYGLITTKHKLIASRRKYSKEDREFKDKIRVFAQFLSVQQWEELVNNRIREKEIKLKIKDLVRYRRNGIKKLLACQEYEEFKLQREKKKEIKKRMHVISPPRTTKTSKKESEDDSSLESKIFFNETDLNRNDNKFIEKMRMDPCANLLSDKEKQLCFALDLSYSRYCAIKIHLLNEFATCRSKITYKGKPPSFMTTALRECLRSFFVQCGWIDV